MCASLFRTSFLCGFKSFPPRQKTNVRHIYTFFGAPPPELLGLICTWIFVKSVTKITCHNTSVEKDQNSARCQVKNSKTKSLLLDKILTIKSDSFIPPPKLSRGRPPLVALPSAQKITLVILSVTSPNCGGKSISSWFFFQGGFLVCLSFSNLFFMWV